MQDQQQTPAVVADPISRIADSACAGDLEGIRNWVRSGVDLTGLDHSGGTLLEVVVGQMAFFPDAPRYEVVAELLRCGADARQLNADGFGPLFAAVLNMDTEMIRILLDAGADPNAEKMDFEFESLYGWAEFDYRYEIWNVNPPERATDADRSDEDAWLAHLDRLAVKYERRRPDHLQLLRQRGALSMAELRNMAGAGTAQSGPSQSVTCQQADGRPKAQR
ncbi:MAG: ankyrin repeat domain-containing protein [Burkholderiaceae bacterium]